ncbi:hypothetical protein BGZ54_002616 [Gamsiella multidivaricata]|nr:hypothetical protein BGZ54_002616 [Gamsiella multidivaricata]
MQTNEQGDEPSYEVGQEQLDAVDRMLEELDLDERFDRVPAAFRIVERFEQLQQLQQEQLQRDLNGEQSHGMMDDNTINGYNGEQERHRDANGGTGPETSLDSGESDEDDAEPFGYIPLDQGNSIDMDEDDNSEDDQECEDAGYGQMFSDGEGDQDDFQDDDDDDESQGYDGYLRTAGRDGIIPVPVIPQAVEIELEDDERAVEEIPEEDLKTIAMVMKSFSLPAPDWAKSIPEERWLPRVVQQAEAGRTPSSSGAGSSSGQSLDGAEPLP